MPLRFVPPSVTKHNKLCVCVRLMEIPLLKWKLFLSGRPISNSTNIFIREERSSQTNLKSYITLLQSPTLNDILQCVSTNTRGTASTKFQLVASVQETTSMLFVSTQDFYYFIIITENINIFMNIIRCQRFLCNDWVCYRSFANIGRVCP